MQFRFRFPSNFDPRGGSKLRSKDGQVDHYLGGEVYENNAKREREGGGGIRPERRMHPRILYSSPFIWGGK